MIRRPGISDLATVWRLQWRGVWLDPLQSMVGTWSPAWTALSAPLRWWSHQPVTYVSSPPEVGMIQARMRSGRPEMDIVFVSPVLEGNEESAAIWRRLLAHCVERAGQIRVQRLFVSVPDAGQDMAPVFHQLGFLPYTREDIYRLRGGAHSPAPLPGHAVHSLTSADEWDVQCLFAAITPRLVQQAEGGATSQAGLPAQRCVVRGPIREFVLRRGDEIAGLILVHSGRRGDCLWLWGRFRDEMEVLSLLRRGLVVLAPRTGRPVYCVLREYQGGVRAVLAECGFEHVASWSCLVKHTVARVREPARAAWHSLEARPEATVPGAGL